MKRHVSAALLLLLSAAAPMTAPVPSATIVRDDAALDRLVDPKAPFRKLGEGFTWSEGPVWIDEGQFLLFSDVPGNRIHKWSEKEGVTVWKDPSGGNGPAQPGFREPGTNGLKPGSPGEILAADHGSRAVASIDLKTKAKRLIVESFEGKKFNSPNDVAVAPDGAIWFTDPPYGLDGINESPLKEQPVNGVYRSGPDGALTLVEANLTFPNGLAFSPDAKTLYVAVSDPKNAVIMAYDVAPDQGLMNRRLFADLTAMVGPANPGLPDGMVVDERGNVWSTGPGGIHVFAPSGKRLGMLRTGTAIANLAFGGKDGKTLFLTSDHMLVSIPTKVRGGTVHRPVSVARGERG